jgi:superfamily II DNA or RNA helicase
MERTMTTDNRPKVSSPLFVVDNSPGGRSGLEYLREWCELASSMDVATGYFEIGALLDLDGDWQKMEKIRILMGDEVAQRTKKALLEAVSKRASVTLDESIESEKDVDPFLDGVPAIVEAIAKGQIECRVYNRDKFHAKAYITHGRFDVVGSQALVGSSNFTRPGLTQNVELNLKIESSAEVAQLQEWYEKHWFDAVDIAPELLRVVERHVETHGPFDVWAKALQSLFANQDPTPGTWERTESRMFAKLDRYQQEGYWALMNIARQHGGALLCDGVGLGKTFVGLMLIERLVLHENKRVVLFAPKAVRDAVWDKDLHKYLPHIGGVSGSADFSNLSVFSHTDLTRGGDFPERFERIAELADVVIIDEAHHFRNLGKRGNPDDPEERSRYWKLYDLIGGASRPKTLYMLTATPINNSLNDFRHLVELFSRGDDAAFARTLGITSLSARLNSMTQSLRKRLSSDEQSDPTDIAEEAQEMLVGDPLFRGLVVQRSRSYARASQIQETGSAAAFPDRQDPLVADYSIRKSYGNLLDLVDQSFTRDQPLFALSIYYPLHYYKGPNPDVDPFEENRQKQVVGLIRTNFLKRFESSVYSFERSCDRLMKKLIAFLLVNSETEREIQRLNRWIDQHQGILDYSRHRQLELWSDADLDEGDDEDVVPPELLDDFERLDREEYEVSDMIQETFLDLDQLATFLEEARHFAPRQDDKLQKLVRLLKSKDLAGKKVLIFTEFADTGRYLRKELMAAGIEGVSELDSGSKLNRAEVISRFSPYYNGSSSADLVAEGLEEIRVLIATDVLSEGLNLQDATLLINYDIHWNPVRLMQRIGRVDRRLNPDVEAQIVADHPEVAKDRGKVRFWNFLPPSELDVLLKLYSKVSHKTLLISKALGIEGKKLLSPSDDYEALMEFNEAYEGEATLQEVLLLEYQELLKQHPGLEERLNSFPMSVFSGKKPTSDDAQGVFFCFRLPALDTTLGEFTLEAGMTSWYLYLNATGDVVEDLSRTALEARSELSTERYCTASRVDLIASRDAVLKHVKNTYLRKVEAPMTSPDPQLVCWMELSTG